MEQQPKSRITLEMFNQVYQDQAKKSQSDDFVQFMNENFEVVGTAIGNIGFAALRYGMEMSAALFLAAMVIGAGLQVELTKLDQQPTKETAQC